MRIISLIPDVEKIVHELDGKPAEFLADAEGKFEVPAEVGAALVKFPHWVQDLGEDAAKAADVVDVDVHKALAAAEARIAELEAKIAGSKKAPAAKKAAAPAADTPSA